MIRNLWTWHIFFVFVINFIGSSFCGMTMAQFKKSLDMMRSVCAPKFKVTTGQLDNLRKGIFDDDREMKCYTLCIGQMAGTITKKNEISLEKTLKQLDAMVPPELRDPALAGVMACKDVQKDYKDPCDKTYYSAKCAYENQPEHFIFP